MADDAVGPAAPKRFSFLHEGWRELRRKLERRRLRGKIAADDRARNAALARLGESAWGAGIDLSDFAELGAQIKTVAARMDELGATTQKLEGEKAAQEQQRQGEVARFDGQRKELDDLKRPVDAALQGQTQKQGAQQREAQWMESRLSAIPGELAALEKEAATPVAPGQEAQSAARGARREQLLTEQSQLSAALPQAKLTLQSMTPEVERLTQESQRFAGEIARVTAERKAALAQIDASLDRLRGELRTTGEASKAAGAERTQRFFELGQGVYEKKRSEPALAEAVQQVQKVEGELAGAAGSLSSSLEETQAMPRGTMGKFFGTLAATPLLLVGLVFGGLFVYERTRPEIRIETPAPINPYLQHPLESNAAYILANQIAEAESEEEVADRLREALETIHVGIYTPDGGQVQAGAERGPNDLFLYDFQVRILAHAYFLRNGMVAAAHTRMLGKGLLELENPAELEPALNGALVQRYQEAQQNPEDPMNFIILLIDGLAHQQAEPYSLNEAHRFERVVVDPIQSLLIMLEFFTRPPPPSAAASAGWKWLPSLVTPAYAQGPCEGIFGDEGQGNWGRGTDVFTEVAQNIPGLAGRAIGFIGNVTGIGGAIADLLILYGMNIRLTPEPYAMHLWHDGPDLTFIQALVTFDAQGVPDAVLKCGWLAGKQMPASGPVKNVELFWDFFPPLDAELHMASEMLEGPNPRLVASAERLRTMTNEAGSSSFLIQPSECVVKRGVIVGKDYMAKVNARLVSSSVPTPGMPGFGLILKLGPGAIEYLMNGRSGYVRFRSEWHEDQPPPPQY